MEIQCYSRGLEKGCFKDCFLPQLLFNYKTLIRALKHTIVFCKSDETLY